MTAYVLDREAAETLASLRSDEAAHSRKLEELRTGGFLVEPAKAGSEDAVEVFRPVEF